MFTASPERISALSDYTTPPGWYPDGDGWERRWDGTGWTADRRRMAEPPTPTQVRPVVAPTPPPAPPPAPAPAPQPAPAPPQPTPSYGQVPPAWSSPPAAPMPAAPTPAAPPRRRTALWAALAVVLVLLIGSGVTLAVLQPWSDDSAGGTDGKDGKDGTDDPTAAGIQGDLDGNGFGDVVYLVHLDYSHVQRVTASSNGKVFTTTSASVEPYAEPTTLHVDWDGDGVEEELRWAFVESGNQLTLSSGDPDFPGEQRFTLDLSSLKKYGVKIQVQAGDFDGDGHADLAVAGPDDKAVDISVLRGDGSGTFADPERWLALPNATIDSTTIRAGDFDDDGRTDLWTELPAEQLSDADYSGYYAGDRGYAMLRSTGKAFEPGAVSKVSIYEDAFLVGDVTGDGTTSLVGVSANTAKEQLVVTVYDLASGRPQPVTSFTGTSTIGNRALQGATLSDVDGDGKADVVFVVKAYKEKAFTGVQVMLSTGSAFDSALVWAETPPCADDSCRVVFPDTRRY